MTDAWLWEASPAIGDVVVTMWLAAQGYGSTFVSCGEDGPAFRDHGRSYPYPLGYGDVIEILGSLLGPLVNV